MNGGDSGLAVYSIWTYTHINNTHHIDTIPEMEHTTINAVLHWAATFLMKNTVGTPISKYVNNMQGHSGPIYNIIYIYQLQD